MGMATVETKPMTADEFFELPAPADGSKLELVKGEVVAMTAPGLEHGEVQVNIGFLLKSFLKANKIGRVVSESGVVTERDEDTVRGPDVSYYSKERLPLGKRVVKYHDLPPDLCVEVVSPSNTRKELRAKINEFFAVNVRMVWVVDPEDRSVTVLTNPDRGQTLYESAELTGGDVLPGFSCKVSELFE
jgi:Uma2 family endonuclease